MKKLLICPGFPGLGWYSVLWWNMSYQGHTVTTWIPFTVSVDRSTSSRRRAGEGKGCWPFTANSWTSFSGPVPLSFLFLEAQQSGLNLFHCTSLFFFLDLFLLGERLGRIKLLHNSSLSCLCYNYTNVLPQSTSSSEAGVCQESVLG